MYDPKYPKRYRLACLVSHPIQYQAPLFRRISAHPEIDLTVLFISDLSMRGYQDPGFRISLKWDVPLLEGYKYFFLPCIGRRDQISFWRPFTIGLKHHLANRKFDALWLHGYAHHVNIRALIIAKSLGVKVLLRGESNLISHPRSWFKKWFKKSIFPEFFKLIDGFLAIGSLNKQYYMHYNVPENRIFWMPYAVDNDFFQSEVEGFHPYREQLRIDLGLQPGRPIILFASKFMPRKRARDLLEAYIRLSPNGSQEPRPYLIFVGDGEQRNELEFRLKKIKWNSVKFLGFKNQTELPSYYDLCDVFVLPSEHEPWGLVVNEVMNAGKAIIVSDQVGCGPDLVREGKNGFTFPVGNIESLSEKLRQITNDPQLMQRMGEASRRIISTWNFEADIEGLLHALNSILKKQKS